MPDSSIKDWFTDAASNGPLGGEVIGTTLDDQLRQIKAIVRQESLNDKQWIRTSAQVAYIDSSSFRIKGTLNGLEGSNQLCQPNRKVLLVASDFSTSVATILTVSTQTITGETWTVCTVFPEVFGGGVPEALSEVKFGALIGINGALPGGILTARRNILFSSSVLLSSSSGSTQIFDVTFSPQIGSSLASGQVFYVQFPATFGASVYTNTGPVYLKINNGYAFEVYKLQANSFFLPVPAFVPLAAGDIAGNQVVALVYDNLRFGSPVFHLVSPTAMTPSFSDLAQTLFKQDANLFDSGSCESGGYMRVMKNLALVWCMTKVVPAGSEATPGTLTVKLPLYSATSGSGFITQVHSVTVTPNKSSGISASAFVVTSANSGEIVIRNPGASAENAYVMAVVGLGS